jgi:hypothetical protein
MDRTLTRLRIAFVVLGTALLVPLFLLVRSAHARLEEQRRLRHEIVAERIFDEMERELTALLEREGERPSAAYDAEATRAETWEPFVVGYFTRDRHGVRVIARAQLDPGRAQRVEQAAERAFRSAARGWLDAQPAPEEAGAMPVEMEEQAREQDAARSSPPAARAEKALPAQQDEVLRKLNRGAKTRAMEPKRGGSNSDRKQQLADDPLSGIDM